MTFNFPIFSCVCNSCITIISLSKKNVDLYIYLYVFPLAIFYVGWLICTSFLYIEVYNMPRLLPSPFFVNWDISISFAFRPQICASAVNATVWGWASGALYVPCSFPMRWILAYTIIFQVFCPEPYYRMQASIVPLGNWCGYTYAFIYVLCILIEAYKIFSLLMLPFFIEFTMNFLCFIQMHFGFCIVENTCFIFIVSNDLPSKQWWCNICN